jgi:hypothetical protein
MNEPETMTTRLTAKEQEMKRLIQAERNSIQEQEKLAERLGKELKRLEALAKQLEESGASSEDLARQVGGRKSEISAAQLAVEVSNAKISELEAGLKGLEPALWLVDYCRKILKEENIPSITGWGDLFGLARLTVVTDDGLPNAVEVEFPCEGRAALEYKVPVRQGSGRMIKGFVPAELRWVPEEWICVESPLTIHYQQHRCEIGGRDGEANRGCLRRVYYLTGEERLMPILRKCCWRRLKASYGYGRQAREEWEEMERDIGGDLLPFCQILEAEIASAGGVLELGKSYAEGSFFSFLNKAVFSVTVPVCEQQFEPVEERLGAEEIAERLQPYWETFVRGPWLPQLNGLLANLKYYCESGERPRFYSGGLKGSYGFRVRTRDHSWILGVVFLLPGKDREAGVEKAELEIRRGGMDGPEYLFRVGRMCAYVEGEERLAGR